MFAVAMAGLAAAVCAAPQRPCSTFEADKTLSGNTATFRDQRSPWVVTADLNSTIRIENAAKKTSCSTMVESVVSVYMGGGDVIYFRSTEIASDQVIPIDGRSCKDAGKTTTLDPAKQDASKSVLRGIGICATH